MEMLAQLNGKMIKKILKIVAFSVATSVLVTCGSYFALYGLDQQFYAAAIFSTIIPVVCSLPVGCYLTFHGQKLKMLNLELSRSREKLIDLNRQLQHEATHDSMTGIFNRGHFLRTLERCAKTKVNHAILLIDADFFKRINDEFGHHKGDEALKKIANTINATVDGNDVVGRVGGEEFAVLLRDHDTGQATQVAERIRVRIGQTKFEGRPGVLHKLSVSIGISCLSEIDLDHPLRKADLALYAAKRNGRNQVSTYAPSMDSLKVA